MRRGDDVGARGEVERGLLVLRAADIHRGAGDALLVERARERRLVDQIAARQVDEEGGWPHVRESGGVHQVLGRLIGDGEADDEIRARQQVLERTCATPGSATVLQGSATSTVMPSATPSLARYSR